jgi:hypothetical protein
VGSISRPSSIPAHLREAIAALIDRAREAEVPIVDVAAETHQIITAFPEAAKIGAPAIADEIARFSVEAGLGVSFTTAGNPPP